MVRVKFTGDHATSEDCDDSSSLAKIPTCSEEDLEPFQMPDCYFKNKLVNDLEPVTEHSTPEFTLAPDHFLFTSESVGEGHPGRYFTRETSPE